MAAIATFSGIELLLVLSVLGCWLSQPGPGRLAGSCRGICIVPRFRRPLVWRAEPVGATDLWNLLPQSLAIQWGYGDETGGYTDQQLAQYRWASLGLAIPVLALIGRLFVGRYGALAPTAKKTRRRQLRFLLPAVWSAVPLRFANRWVAMIWLELRQSVPLAAMGLLFALLMAIASVLIEPRYHSYSTSVLSEMPSSMFIVGMLWAVVVGANLYSAELSPGLGSFWRSLPISTGAWFWSKFVVGLLAVLAVLDGVTIVASWNAPRDSMTTGMSWAYVGCFPLIHALMYALAVLGTCWLRRPVVGGVLAILGFAVLNLAITAFPATYSLEPIYVFNLVLSAEREGDVDFTRHGYPLVYGSLAVLTLAVALLASRLARPLEPASRWFATRAA